MRRMIFWMAAFGALVLGIAWPLSYAQPISMGCGYGSVIMGHGECLLAVSVAPHSYQLSDPPSEHGTAMFWRTGNSMTGMFLGSGGFHGPMYFVLPGSAPSARIRMLILPVWWLLLEAAIIALAAHFVRRRRRATECRGCGYDLTGNMSGRCPECGRAVGACSCSGSNEWLRTDPRNPFCCRKTPA